MNEWLRIFPELDMIESSDLRKKCIETYIDALSYGGWTPEDLNKIPMGLRIKNNPPSLRTHIRAVTRIAENAWQSFNELHEASYVPNHDELIAGALLHDVGKIIEYARISDGTYGFSSRGLLLRHPLTGAMLAMKHGLPDAIVHIIATHAREGDGYPRTPEALMVKAADELHFYGVLALEKKTDNSGSL